MECGGYLFQTNPFTTAVKNISMHMYYKSVQILIFNRTQFESEEKTRLSDRMEIGHVYFWNSFKSSVMSTPWSSSGSLSSDRIKPRHTAQPQKQKQKQKPTQPQPRAQQTPKSKQLISLESLQTTTTPVPDPKGGCFCQGKPQKLPSIYPSHA